MTGNRERDVRKPLVCVGGPWDGRLAIHSESEFFALATTPARLVVEGRVAEPTLTVRYQYALETLYYRDGLSQYFWRYYEMPLPEAVARVFDAYAQEKIADGEI